MELHIIGMGTEGLQKQTVEEYNCFKRADLILTISEQHPCIKDLIEGKFKVEVVGSDQTTQSSISLAEIISIKLLEISSISDLTQVVLALPGVPLAEGKLIRRIRERVGTRYLVRLDTLSKDSSLKKLTAIMEELRKPQGCPWDREQTHISLKKYAIEETYEVIDAIDANNMHNLCEELGDLLLQVVFHAVIGQEEETFTLEQIIKGISQKLIRRHPHVFGSVKAENSDEVIENWEMIKKKEKVGGSGYGDDYFDIPSSLPALMLAAKTQKKAAKIGFDWDHYQGPLAKVYEEIQELEQAITARDGIDEELGDLLFSVVNVSRFLKVDAEEALRQCVRKFQKRFKRMLQLVEEKGLDFTTMGIAELDKFWDLAKIEENNGK